MRSTTQGRVNTSPCSPASSTRYAADSWTSSGAATSESCPPNSVPASTAMPGTIYARHRHFSPRCHRRRLSSGLARGPSGPDGCRRRVRVFSACFRGVSARRDDLHEVVLRPEIGSMQVPRTRREPTRELLD